MIHETIDMTVEGSIGTPTLTTYILDYEDCYVFTERPLVLICPGGGYENISGKESLLPCSSMPWDTMRRF